MIKFSHIPWLFCFTGIASCGQPITEFNQFYDISKEKNVVLEYYQGPSTSNVKIEFKDGNVVTKNGTRIKLTGDEVWGLKRFFQCIETGEGFKWPHEHGFLKVTIAESKLSRKIWNVENSHGCSFPVFLSFIGSDEFSEGVDYSTPYWRRPLIDDDTHSPSKVQ